MEFIPRLPAEGRDAPASGGSAGTPGACGTACCLLQEYGAPPSRRPPGPARGRRSIAAFHRFRVSRTGMGHCPEKAPWERGRLACGPSTNLHSPPALLGPSTATCRADRREASGTTGPAFSWFVGPGTPGWVTALKTIQVPVYQFSEQRHRCLAGLSAKIRGIRGFGPVSNG